MISRPHTTETILGPAKDVAAAAMPPPGGSQLGAVFEVLTGNSPVLATIYLLARLLIPALLISIVTRGASAEQRIALLRDYLPTTTRDSRRR
jgi:hypothetical protein